MSPISSLFDSDNSDNVLEEMADFAVDVLSAGMEATESVTGSGIPVKVEERDGRKMVEAELPFLSGDEISIDSGDGGLSVSIERSREVEGRDFDRDGLEDTLKDLFEIPGDVDSSTLDVSFEDGVLRMEADMEEDSSRSDHEDPHEEDF